MRSRGGGVGDGFERSMLTKTRTCANPFRAREECVEVRTHSRMDRTQRAIAATLLTERFARRGRVRFQTTPARRGGSARSRRAVQAAVSLGNLDAKMKEKNYGDSWEERLTRGEPNTRVWCHELKAVPETRQKKAQKKSALHRKIFFFSNATLRVGFPDPGKSQFNFKNYETGAHMVPSQTLPTLRMVAESESTLGTDTAPGAFPRQEWWRSSGPYIRPDFRLLSSLPARTCWARALPQLFSPPPRRTARHTSVQDGRHDALRALRRLARGEDRAPRALRHEGPRRSDD